MPVTQAERNKIATNVWTARVIPIVLAGVVGYASYVLVALLCVNYLLRKHNDTRAVIPILVIYCILFLLMAISFFRLVFITIWDPPYLPLGPGAVREQDSEKGKGRVKRKEDDIAGGEYDPGNSSGDVIRGPAGYKDDPDSPGLELFYTKDVFVCEMDGKPRWCSSCANWKPDRSHHCSASGRCILKMDHFCPWVGGPVGENNFKFFIQFTGYTALYCTHILVVMAIYVHQQLATEGETINPQFAAILALAGFFGLFTAGMTGTSIHLALFNLTQVEQLGAKTRVHLLAVLKPSRDALIQINPTLASEPPPYHEITYPLRASDALSFSQNSTMVVPGASSILPPKTTVGESSNTGDRSSLPPSSTITRGLKAGDGLSLSQDSTIAGGSDENQTKLTVQSNIPSERDLQATRSFAVLRMLEPGDNPWDLGSLMLNWKTVMGNHVIDWFLPIKRSPCCNHEQSESQFSVGPWVDLLRVKHGFLEPQDIRVGGKRFQRRAGPELSRAKTRVRRRAKRSTTVSNVGESSRPTNESIKLQSLNNHARQ